ncbi:EAL and HDOD domain-containing protein [Geobacter sp. AOG2]|uniref:EAL and HDOD domain-containing protein n=1 Tax=Geobacter sp. AOG2 TaxID=1566347 RepID=UPI001CC6FB09|nr:HDOD domain-containing protein [Geobacter sp. AOG2]GFE60055.1 cyclic diguanylate phosphodiesterase [Geobacter sp. AOG2]
MPHANYLIGRQPILDRNEQVVAYELLFRTAAAHNTATIADATQATASVIINALSGFGLERILGNHRGFINMELDLLLSDSLGILPWDRVVLELLESLVITPKLVERCRVLKQEGFQLALDDHEYDPAYEELYGIVDIVKIDLLQTPPSRLAGMVEKFRPYPVKLLAEKVETRDEYRLCLDLGFEYFQGFYFAKPSVMEKKRFDESGSTLLKLMDLLMKDAELEMIEQAFRASPGLTYKLLLLVNSVSLGLRGKIQNIRHAVALLGRQQIKRWVQLALFVSDAHSGPENPLVEFAAVRAAFMEQLAYRHSGLKDGKDAGEQAFLTGILSVLGSIYDISIDEILANLSLSEAVKEALTNRGGALGQLLQLSEQLENLDARFDSDWLEEMGLSQEYILAAQVKAYGWRDGML